MSSSLTTIRSVVSYADIIEDTNIHRIDNMRTMLEFLEFLLNTNICLILDIDETTVGYSKEDLLGCEASYDKVMEFINGNIGNGWRIFRIWQQLRKSCEIDMVGDDDETKRRYVELLVKFIKQGRLIFLTSRNPEDRESTIDSLFDKFSKYDKSIVNHPNDYSAQQIAEKLTFKDQIIVICKNYKEGYNKLQTFEEFLGNPTKYTNCNNVFLDIVVNKFKNSKLVFFDDKEKECNVMSSISSGSISSGANLGAVSSSANQIKCFLFKAGFGKDDICEETLIHGDMFRQLLNLIYVLCDGGKNVEQLVPNWWNIPEYEDLRELLTIENIKADPNPEDLELTINSVLQKMRKGYVGMRTIETYFSLHDENIIYEDRLSFVKNNPEMLVGMLVWIIGESYN